ncbi:hypothetical protein AORI_2897 [Amycolatopsis keratiniphila]|uniref:Uncharacterized protein n=1 Tax=Amycolatopsis keratiniphila TaxID=129921 RepID=R4T495_9PSEU|nr:hypothetical protein AORI_2897 [Amycolatopsis keratiniphila]
MNSSPRASASGRIGPERVCAVKNVSASGWTIGNDKGSSRSIVAPASAGTSRSSHERSPAGTCSRSTSDSTVKAPPASVLCGQ